MAYQAAFEEEELSTKLSITPWLKVLKYAFKYWYLLIPLFISLFLISVYDSSFTPLMNEAALVSASEYASGLSTTTSIWSMSLTVRLSSSLAFSMSFRTYVIVLLIALVVRSLMIFASFYLTDYLEIQITSGLRRDAFAQVQKLSFAFFDRTNSGWLIARLQGDTQKISGMLSWGVLRILWISFDLTITLITMFVRSWKLSLVILSTVPLVMIIAPLFERMILRLSRVARNAYSRFVAWLAESINGAKTIKTLSIEETIYDEANHITEDIRQKTYERRKKQSFFMPSINLIAAITTGLLIVVAEPLGLSMSSVVDMGILILFIGFTSRIYDPIIESAELFADIVATQANVEKVLSLIEEQPIIQDTPEVIEKYGTLLEPNVAAYEEVDGKIEFKNVSFEYVADMEVIRDLTLTIEQGQRVAIVGETGSGKTTLVNLLSRFYEPVSGGIYIDGVEYRDRSVGWLRSNIGYVQQNPFIFSGTIADNIRYGKLDASDEEIRRAAKIVSLDGYVNSLPDKYNSELADQGADLSVGQKQLISFARAIIRNPKIMILDEATSSIDTETEALIQSALKKVLAGRTSIVIAHRLSTIVDSDRILFMDNGVIVEDGSHAELMKRKGQYYNLYMNQFKELHLDSQLNLFDKQIKNIID